jgi:hypothetical protein
LACVKSKKSLWSRTRRGKFSTVADAGMFAPSGVVRMIMEPLCFQPGGCAPTEPRAQSSDAATIAERMTIVEPQEREFERGRIPVKSIGWSMVPVMYRKGSI